MAATLRAKGLAMECLDAFEYLDKQPDRLDRLGDSRPSSSSTCRASG